VERAGVVLQYDEFVNVSEETCDYPLWLAGGLGPGNIRATVRRWQPELVDASRGVEASPGVKERAALQRFFAEIAAGGES
jgi:phosphoribosylanthranilate isomerase